MYKNSKERSRIFIFYSISEHVSSDASKIWMLYLQRTNLCEVHYCLLREESIIIVISYLQFTDFHRGVVVVEYHIDNTSIGVCFFEIVCFNPLNAELNPICYLLALLAHHFLHVSRIRAKSLTLRLLMSYIYGAPILDVSRSHTTTQHSR